jgi:acyl-CoA thioester hydrolase
VTTPLRPENPLGVHRTRIEWIDTDAAGIYHNSTVVRFVEAAEASLMDGLGLHGCFPVAPRVRYEVDFDAPSSSARTCARSWNWCGSAPLR